MVVAQGEERDNFALFITKSLHLSDEAAATSDNPSANLVAFLCITQTGSGRSV